MLHNGENGDPSGEVGSGVSQLKWRRLLVPPFEACRKRAEKDAGADVPEGRKTQGVRGGGDASCEKYDYPEHG